jgi:hypothetical protein
MGSWGQGHRHVGTIAVLCIYYSEILLEVTECGVELLMSEKTPYGVPSYSIPAQVAGYTFDDLNFL